jgi:DNA (cytosine-5)-methyltransferase 1
VSAGRPPTQPPHQPARQLRIGSLCTGYGGLDLAVQAVLDARLAWYAEVDRHAQTVLAHHFPGVTNLGDIRTIDWHTVAPVDIVTAGFPCQDYPE